MTLTLPVTSARSVRVPDLRPGDVVVGEDHGASRVYDVSGESLFPGFCTVRTEHGTLLLDLDDVVEVLRS